MSSSAFCLPLQPDPTTLVRSQRQVHSLTLGILWAQRLPAFRCFKVYDVGLGPPRSERSGHGPLLEGFWIESVNKDLGIPANEDTGFATRGSTTRDLSQPDSKPHMLLGKTPHQRHFSLDHWCKPHACTRPRREPSSNPPMNALKHQGNRTKEALKEPHNKSPYYRAHMMESLNIMPENRSSSLQTTPYKPYENLRNGAPGAQKQRIPGTAAADA